MINVRDPGRQIDWVLPGLFHIPAQLIDGAALKALAPNLYKLLSRADKTSQEAADFDEILRQLLGLIDTGLPYAQALSQSVHALLFTPVYLKADINNAIVFPVDTNQDELDILINDLSDFFKPDFKVKKLDNSLWLMQLKQIKPVLNLPHQLNALGKKVTHYLAQARANLAWFKLFNEIQMFLHQHPINQQRLQQSQMMINSLWCWGGDSYHETSKPYSAWFSDDNELAALGRLFADQTGGLAQIKQAAPNAKTMVVDLRILRALKSARDIDLQQLLIDIEQDYLGDLIKYKKAITLHTGDGVNCVYQGWHHWRLWRHLDWPRVTG